MSAFAGILGAGFAAGVLLLAAGMRRRDPHDPPSALRTRVRWDRSTQLRLCAAIGAAVLTVAVTRWVVGAGLAAAAVWALPAALGPDRQHAMSVARFEAIAGWAQMLRDTLTAAAGLEQAVVVTAPLAPAAIRAELLAAAGRLERGEPLPAVLRRLGVDLDDSTADLVIAALVLAAEQRARNLGDLLGSLAQAARDHAALRMRVQATRAHTKTAARITVGTTLVFAGGLVLLDRPYLSAYNDATGQLVLLAVGGLFAGGFWWLTHIAKVREPARLNTTPTSGTALTGGAG